MSESPDLWQQLLNNNTAVISAVAGSLLTGAFGLVAYFWRLSITANANKNRLENQASLTVERDKHLNTKVESVNDKVDKIDANVDKLTDKVDKLVDAQYKTHEILVTHISHEEAQEKVISSLTERLSRDNHRATARK